jgi:flagellar motor component MotA
MATKMNAYKEWLGILYSLLTLARRQGLAVLEQALETPVDKGSVFQALPASLRSPYVEFMADLVHTLGFGNLQDADGERYVAIALESFSEQETADERLMRMISLGVQYFMKGYAPDIACEFARQSLPLKHRPDRTALRDWMERHHPPMPGVQPASVDLFKEDIDRFMASIGGKDAD